MLLAPVMLSMHAFIISSLTHETPTFITSIDCARISITRYEPFPNSHPRKNIMILMMLSLQVSVGGGAADREDQHSPEIVHN